MPSAQTSPQEKGRQKSKILRSAQSFVPFWGENAVEVFKLWCVQSPSGTISFYIHGIERGCPAFHKKQWSDNFPTTFLARQIFRHFEPK